MQRRWTEDELSTLERMYKTRSLADCAIVLARTENAVHKKIVMHGFRRKERHYWTAEEDQQLRELYGRKIDGRTHAKELSKTMGRTSKAIETRAFKLGIARRVIGKTQMCSKCQQNPREDDKSLCAECRKKSDRLTTHQRSLRSYGITAEDWYVMYDTQVGKCAICGVPIGRPGTKKQKLSTASVDHDHASGVVRGLLCPKCNCLLGMADDNSEILKSAIEYLRRSHLKMRSAG